MKTIFGLFWILTLCNAFILGQLLARDKYEAQITELQKAGYELQQKYRLCDVPKFEGNI